MSRLSFEEYSVCVTYIAVFFSSFYLSLCLSKDIQDNKINPSKWVKIIFTNFIYTFFFCNVLSFTIVIFFYSICKLLVWLV